jgi:hypothetical protein
VFSTKATAFYVEKGTDLVAISLVDFVPGSTEITKKLVLSTKATTFYVEKARLIMKGVRTCLVATPLVDFVPLSTEIITA